MEKLRAYLCYSAALICVFLFGALLYASGSEEGIQVATVSTEIRPTIIIDAGHGGEDGGASDNGVLEKDVNLSVALKLRDMLQVLGYPVKMTRETDVSIYDNESDSVREKKVSDMKNRVSIINSSKDNILISIHQNKFTQSKYSGAQIFYSDNSPESIRMAECIRRSVTGLLQPDNKRELKADDGSVYILKNAEVPAVIVECGFLSNAQEAALLKTEEYQEKMAFAIMCGALDFLNSRQ